MQKVVLVLGGTRNTGIAVVRKFASQGFAVALTSRRQAEADRAAAETAADYPVPVRGYETDMRSVASVRALFARVREDFGRVDVMVTVAADLGMGFSVMDATEEAFDNVMDTNIKGCFFCCQEAAHLMQEQGGGSIVLIGSVHGGGAVWGRSLYATSKGAVHSMVRNLALELAEYHIRVNEVVPGAVRTDRWDGISPEEEARRRRNWPTGREADPSEIAEGVWYLSSDAAKSITGTDLVIDSGVSACLLAYNGGQH